MSADGLNGQYNAECGMFVEALYEQFLDDPGSVSADWSAHFKQLDAEAYVPHEEVRQEMRMRARNRSRHAGYAVAAPSTRPSLGRTASSPAPSGNSESEEAPRSINEEKQSAVIRMINNFSIWKREN